MIQLNLQDIYTNGKTPVVTYTEYEEPRVNMAEMFRYSGIPMDKAKKLSEITEAEADDADRQLLQKAEKVITLAKGSFVYKTGFLSGRLMWDGEGYPVLPVEQKSENLKKNLRNCEAYVMFAATVGSGIDRLIRRYELSDPSMGVMFQGYGAERVESLCNNFCEDVRTEAEKSGYTTHPRFSPGFGDLPITVQKEFLDCLDAGRRMGITLGASYLMSPSKSVTAIIGLEKI